MIEQNILYPSIKVSVYFEHEIHETSLTTQKLYENNNKKIFRVFRVKKKLKQKYQNRQLPIKWSFLIW
jgi:hypothetical protein